MKVSSTVRLLGCHPLVTVFSYLLFCRFFAASLSIGNETDRLALVAFKERISDDPLKIMSSWNDSVHHCNWPGVSCSKRHPGRVTIIKLVMQKLAGTLPPDVGNLSFLHQINLTENYFRGEIPEDVGKLQRLQYLDLTKNTFVGEIPRSLSNCSRFLVINFNYNHLVGEIPFELSRLASRGLQRLLISENNLTGSIPTWLGNASILSQLSLAENNLQGTIPSELGSLSNLILLQVSSNNLTGTIPPSIYNLSALMFIDVGTNQLHGRIPSDVGLTLSNLLGASFGRNYFDGLLPLSFPNATRLARLDMGSNRFTGTVPSNLGSLKDLSALASGGNFLEDVVGEEFHFLTSLTNCSKLQILDVGHNRFKGELPTSVANFSDTLAFLSVELNQITGTIPQGIEALAGLTYLSFSSNFITGKIPEGIGKLQYLQELHMSRNRISGSIPKTLGNITVLQQLYLQENDLEGEIPPSLGDCQQLEQLFINQNRLTGEIPKEVLSLASLSIYLNLAQNFLTGVLPTEVGKLSKLVALDLTGNRLSGSIPSSIGGCEMMERLRLGNNSFEGSIPSTLSNLKTLSLLDLSRNNLSGNIPSFLQNYTFLKFLNLSYNNLEGEVPQGGIFRNESGFSIVGNEKLCGGLKSWGLPACHTDATKSSRVALVLKVTLPVGILCALVLLACLLWLKRGRAESSSEDLFDKNFLKVSYAELAQATNGFSSSNLIGQGGHSYVYKGILPRSPEMPVAVKVLNLARKGAARSFLAECSALRTIRHRNLLKIITACSSIDFKGADFKALVFEWMPNGSLEEWLHQSHTSQLSNIRRLTLPERLSIATDVARALEYLHHYCETPVVHGDLKPSNILLDAELAAHVGDFGLAKILREFQIQDTSQSTMSSSGFKGTVGYIAPEYGMGGMQSLEGDVYSFGILVLEMVTGKRPTNEMFNNGMDLHQAVKIQALLPENVGNNVLEIVDTSLLLNAGDDGKNAKATATETKKTRECIIAFLSIGVACSKGSPGERPSMRDVVAEMQRIKANYFAIHN